MEKSFIHEPLRPPPDALGELWEMHRSQMQVLLRIEALLQTLVAQGSTPAPREPTPRTHA